MPTFMRSHELRHAPWAESEFEARDRRIDGGTPEALPKTGSNVAPRDRKKYFRCIGHQPCCRLEMDLARHFDTASRLSPKSAAIAVRLLAKSAMLLKPEAGTALRSALQAKSSQAEELSGSDLMVLATHDRPSRSPFGFAFETANHRMARHWIENVMKDQALRWHPPESLRG